MTSGNDKRKETRIPVDLWIEAEREGELYYQRAGNLSVGGAFFVQTIPLPVGTRVSLKFTLPGDTHEIVCEGDIVSAKDFGMGVQFVGLVPGDRARIEKVIAKLAKAVSDAGRTPRRG
jgi:type IV pilus assembly protein PilZ